MIVRTKISARLDALLSVGVGFTILVGLLFSPYPTDVLTNLSENPQLAAVSVLVCAVTFGVAALFVVGGLRLWAAYARTLEFTANGFILRHRLGRKAIERDFDDVVRIVAIPSERDLTAWVLEFRDGSAFAADSGSVNFREAFETLREKFQAEIEEISLEGYDPWRRTPDWLDRLMKR